MRARTSLSLSLPTVTRARLFLSLSLEFARVGSIDDDRHYMTSDGVGAVKYLELRALAIEQSAN